MYANPLTQAATLGTPITVTTIPGQNAALTFTATGKTSFLFTGVTDGSTAISGINATLTTGGTTVKTFSFGNSDKFVDTLTLTAGTAYKLTLDPQGTNSGSITTTIYAVPADFTTTGTLGAAASAVTVATPGQNAKLTFSGTAGHSLSLFFNGNTIGNPLFNPTVVNLTSQTGTLVRSFTLYSHDTMIESIVLPTTGTYTLSFDPNGSNTGTFNVALYDVPADATGSNTIGGGNVTATTTTPGQNAAFTFTSTNPTTVTVSYDASSCCPVQISVLLGGVVVKSAGSYLPGDPFTFTPAAGTNIYTIKVDPTYNNVGALTVSVS